MISRFREALSHTIRPAGVPLAWRQLTSRKLRLTAAVAGISFAALMMLMQLGFRDALYDSVVLLHQSFSGELVIVNSQYDSLADSRMFSRRRLNQARAVSGVIKAKAIYTGLASWKNPDTMHDRTIFVIGCDPAVPPLHLTDSEQSSAALQRPDQVLFDSASRQEFGQVKERLLRGENVVTEIAGQRMTVGGLFTLGTSFAADGNVLMGEAAFHRLFMDRSPNMVSLGVLELAPDASVLGVQATLKKTLPEDVMVLTRKELMDQEKDYWARRTPIGFVISAGLIIGFIVGSVIVYQILYTDLSDHLKEYAVLKATGCSDAFLHSIVVQQSVILAVAGFVPAAVLAAAVFWATRVATSLPAYLDISKSAIVLSLTLAMCIISGMFALRVLRHADPAEVF